MRVVYLGTPEFAVRPLEELLAAGHEVVAVVTPPPRPAGRGRQSLVPPVAEAATRRGLSVLPVESASDPVVLEELARRRPDALITASFGQYLTAPVLALASHGVLNIHPSLLPRYRGASPVQSQLLAGETVTGVTLLRSVAKMDAGPILAQQQVPVLPDESAGELTARLFALGGRLLVELLARLAAGPLAGEPQDEARATRCRKIGREQARLDWSRPAAELVWAIRAFDPAPVAWTTLRGKQLRIFRAHVGAASLAGPAVPGWLGGPPAQAELLVCCGAGWLQLDEVQLEGGRRLPARELARGLRLGPEGVELK
ncbi:MAG: methionyl-tRNA formyltransferase [Myxococcota bacterium]|nr:methionyl-tRNA formyltransferase [Myxococcota bacterium]